MKKYLFTSLLLFGLLVTPAFAGMSVTDYIAQLELQIKNLTAQLNTLLAQQQNKPQVCYDFVNNLRLGDGGYGGGSRSENYSDRDVHALRNFLIKDGVADFVQEEGTAGSSIKNSSFSEAVKRAVIKFQSKYGIEQTGFVGPLTRGQLNKLYGCKNDQPIACAADAMQCSDGSYVGRSGPNCQFVCSTGGSKPLVVSPNGGEIWVSKSVQSIKWTQINPSSYKKVDIYLEGNPHYTPSCSVVGTACAQVMLPTTYVLDKNISSNQSSNIYNWIVGTDINDKEIHFGGSNLRICEAGSTTNCDESDNLFTIKPSTKVIEVLSPNGGEMWEAESVKQIKWKTSDSIDKINLYLEWDPNSCLPNSGACTSMASAMPPYVLDRNIPTHRIYNWIVGTDENDKKIRPGYYKVMICDESDNQCAFSGTFIIEEE